MNFKIVLAFVAIALTAANLAQAQNPGASKAMNPDIGANFLITDQKNTSKTGEGIAVQEAEFAFKSDVDPYLVGTMIFSVAPRSDNAKEFKIDPEEIYVDTTFIPNLTLRAGKFYGLFGRHNILHTHAFPFIDAPLVNQAILGDGFNDAGISASYLFPFAHFLELTLQGFDNFKGLAHARTLFEINDDSTVELGVSGVTKYAWGADLTYKHRPTDRGQGRRLNFSEEWMSGRLDGYTTILRADGKPTQGLAEYVQYEFLPHTYAQYRFDDLISEHITRHGILLAYSPSEFSVFRIQYDQTRTQALPVEHRGLAQLNITIGAHPAHDY